VSRTPVSGAPSVPINVLLTPEDKEALDRQARLEERSAAAVVRRAIRDYVAAWEPLRR
jgi:predicted transcriptional regulator